MSVVAPGSAVEQPGRLVRDGLHDSLTGLASRALFHERVEQALSRASHPPAVFLCDLDRFAMVNESLGQQAGDEILRCAARRLERAVGTGSTLARLDGDVFAVVCEGLDGEREAIVAADRLLAAFDAALAVDDEELHVSASVGIALATPPADAGELVTSAGTAMSRAKESGGGRYEIYDPAMAAGEIS